MGTIFLDYFYHDVLVKKISYNLENESSPISFILNDTENGDFDDTECIFREIYFSSIKMPHNIIAEICIALAKEDNTDDFLLEYKKEMTDFIPERILNNLKCYSIYTSNGGEIKIISECDVKINPTPISLE